MKVILLEDVKGTGKKGQVIDASDGHALNFLLPRKLAVEASKKNIAELEAKERQASHKLEKEVESARELAERIKSAKLVIKVKVGENGRMYGSVSNKEVAEALQVQANIGIDRKKVTVCAVKSVGEYTAAVKLHPQVSVTLPFEVAAL